MRGKEGGVERSRKERGGEEGGEEREREERREGVRVGELR